jgi:two-component system chemotaxis sensor kinase CheA
VEALARFLPHTTANRSQDRSASKAAVAPRQRHKIFFKPHQQVFFSGTDPVNVVDELRALGTTSVTAQVEGVPQLESLNPEFCYLAWDVDLLSGQGKEAELVLEGEDTELDKTVIEKIADPLVHLVRNSADHGIESPEVRLRAGKPGPGKITLRAYNQENNVIIEVHDDGQGMDTTRLKQKALEKGLITPAAAETLDSRAALELIFLPGLTTAEKVTDISGRGVGMDVVRSNIRQLHGTITLESHRGLGSKITITLPASLMVSKGILVEAGGEAYVFPIVSVVQLVRLPRQQVHGHAPSFFAAYRNDVYPILRLTDHFASDQTKRDWAWPEEVPLAIVQTERGRVGVAVDRFLGHVEVIVKPLGEDFANITAFQGATIMGDGRVALVINPSGFIP